MEKGSPAEGIVATKYGPGAGGENKVVMTRPLCAYPTVATYSGSGDTNNCSKLQLRRAVGRSFSSVLLGRGHFDVASIEPEMQQPLARMRFPVDHGRLELPRLGSLARYSREVISRSPA